MLRKLQLISIVFLLPFLCIANTSNTTTQNNNSQQQIKYYCPIDKEYKAYKGGTGQLEQVRSFTDEKVCQSQCLSQNQCIFVGAQSSGVVVANIVSGMNLNLSQINASLQQFSKIVGIKIVAGGIEAMSVSDLSGISLNELFVPIKDSDVSKGGIAARVNAGNVTLTSIESGNTLLQITDTSLIKNSGSGTYKAEHKTRKVKVPMTADEINKLTLAQRTQYQDAYKQALQNYQNGTSIYNPSSPYVKDGTADEQYTLITAENGKISEQAGWVDFAVLAGISYSSSNVSYEMSYFDEDENKNKTEKVNIPLTNGYGEYLFYIEGTTKNTIQVGQDTISFNSTLKDSKNIDNITYSVEKNGVKVSGDFQVEILNQDTSDRFTCRTDSNIMGDLGPNAFSDEKSCSTQCLVNNVCVTIAPEGSTDDNNCTILSSEFLNPITDVNGKTIYLGKRVTKKCTIFTETQVGCRQYETQTTNSPDLEKLLGVIPAVQTNKKNHDFSKAVSVFGTMALAENATHIFGGEAGFCDVGQFLPNAMDMVQLAIKYAMMIGSGIAQNAGGVADAMGEAGEQASNAAQKAGGNIITQSVKGATAAAKAGWSQFTSNIAKNATQNIAEQIAKNAAVKIASTMVTEALKEVCDSKGIDGLCSKKEAQRTSAWVTGSTDGILSNEGLDGATDEQDKIAMDYANCMSGRFGLTYEAVLAWQMGTREVNELHYSFKVPMIMDATEINMLRMVMENENAAAADIDKYFYARYNLQEAGVINGKQSYALYALKGEDVLIAAETVCGGVESLNIIRKKYGDRFLNPQYAPPNIDIEYPPQNELEETEILPGLTEDGNSSTSDGTTGADKTLQVTNMIAGILPFPYNVAASVVVDVFTQAQENGNTCTDMQFAERRATKDPTDGEEYIRTNKRISLGLCHQVSTEARTKMLGETILKRKHYCCYDQITTRIFAEGMMSQLGKKATRDNCAPLEIEDLNKVSFRACESNENPAKDSCFPVDKFKELTNAYMSGASIGVEEAVGNIVNSVFQLDERQ